MEDQISVHWLIFLFPAFSAFSGPHDLPARLQTAYAFLSVIIRGLKSLGRNHRNRGNLLLHRQHFPSQNQLPFSESQGFRSGLLQHIMVHRTHRLSKKYQFLAFLPGFLPATETNLSCSGFIINDHFQFVNSFFELFSKNFIMCPIWAVFWKNDPKKRKKRPLFSFPCRRIFGRNREISFPFFLLTSRFLLGTIQNKEKALRKVEPSRKGVPYG